MRGLGPTTGQSVTLELCATTPGTLENQLGVPQRIHCPWLRCQCRQQHIAPAWSCHHLRENFIRASEGCAPSQPFLKRQACLPDTLVGYETSPAGERLGVSIVCCGESQRLGRSSPRFPHTERGGRAVVQQTVLGKMQNPPKLILSPVAHALPILALPSLLQSRVVFNFISFLMFFVVGLITLPCKLLFLAGLCVAMGGPCTGGVGIPVDFAMEGHWCCSKDVGSSRNKSPVFKEQLCC